MVFNYCNCNQRHFLGLQETYVVIVIQVFYFNLLFSETIDQKFFALSP